MFAGDLSMPNALGKPDGKGAAGGVVPPGYPNDSYHALLTSGETVTPMGGSSPDVAQLAAAIVSAINNQTKALTSNGFGDYYA